MEESTQGGSLDSATISLISLLVLIAFLVAYTFKLFMFKNKYKKIDPHTEEYRIHCYHWLYNHPPVLVELINYFCSVFSVWVVGFFFLLSSVTPRFIRFLDWGFFEYSDWEFDFTGAAICLAIYFILFVFNIFDWSKECKAVYSGLISDVPFEKKNSISNDMKIISALLSSKTDSLVIDTTTEKIQYKKSIKTNENINMSESQKIEILKKYKELLDSGAISEEEYNLKKQELLK